MPYIASFVVLIGCVKLLPEVGPMVTAGVFTAAKLAIVLLLGGGLGLALVLALILGAVSFGYFWLLNRTDGSALWWVVLAAGVLLLV